MQPRGLASAPTQVPTHPGYRILVVDDDMAIRELSTAVLTPRGYDVETAADGAAGWVALHASSYDLLITDNRMPKVSGVELIKKLRSARMALPVVLVTSDIAAEELNQDPPLNLAALLLKPFSILELLETVNQALSATESAYTQTDSWFPSTKRAPTRSSPCDPKPVLGRPRTEA